MPNSSFVAVATAAALSLPAAFASAQTLTVVTPSTHVDSKPLRDLDHGNAPVHGLTQIRHHHGVLPDEPETPPLGTGQFDSVTQATPGPLISAADGLDFEGLGVNGYVPSDNNVAIGPNYIVETVNVMYAVYTKTGVLVTSGFLKSLWNGLGGSCAANNGGDPVVQYDRFADRWLITQLGSLSAPYAECIAVSKTGDPTGAYSLYSYSFGSSLNDYPKFGVWPTATNSAYLATYNLFYGGASGSELCAYDRAAMLAGAASPISICTTVGTVPDYSFLPSDVDGPTRPLDGTPGYFVNLASLSSLSVYKLSPNFATPAASTLTGPTTIPVSQFSQPGEIPQPGTATQLDSLDDRLMNRLAFRVFADHESMVTSHTVATGGVAGMRWYELRAPVSASGTFSMFQQGTWAPADGNYRWMGSIAMDSAGDMGLGYSVSGPSTFPSIRYTGRTPADPAGAMETEAVLINGLGSQTGTNRWGDYSSMQIDPADDCTFWYVNEYYTTTSSASWHTRIGSFKFNSCGAAPQPDFALSANPSSFSRAQGTSGTSTITVNSINGFSENVSLSVLNGCPTGATCTLNPASIAAGGNSTLTVTLGASTPTGPYTITIQGSGGSGNHTTTVGVTVTPASGDFGLSLSPTSMTVNRKSFNTTTITLTNGNAPVNLSVNGLPSKLTATFTPNPANSPGSATLRISANPNAPLGTFTVTVIGTSGGFTHQQNLTVIVAR